jgi:hypothetical protein
MTHAAAAHPHGQPSAALTTALVTALLVAGCAATSDDQAPTSPLSQRGHDAPPDLEHLTFQGIEEHAITLDAGTWLGEPYLEGASSRPRVDLLDQWTTTGDLDQDSEPEAVALLAATGGGTGVFVHLALLKRTGGTWINVDTVLIGDRVRIQELELADARIRLQTLEAGPDDAMCCPTQRMTRWWSLDGDRLLQQPSPTALRDTTLPATSEPPGEAGKPPH